MVKFLLSLPLGIFIIAEAIIVYMLGDIIFKAATDSTAAGLVGEWNFFQVLLAMVGMTIGIILAAFFYATVILKPVFYPQLEEDKPIKQKRIIAEQKKKSKKSLIIILIIGTIIIAAGITGFIFREEIFNFIGTFISSEDNVSDEDSADSEDNEDVTEPESEPEPEVPATLSYSDLIYKWKICYPASLTIREDLIEDDIFREPPSDTDTKLWYWSTYNVDNYAGAADYEAADPSGILATAIASKVLDDNTIICRADRTDSTGETFPVVYFWYIEPGGIASAAIPCETAEKADEWYNSLESGAIYIEKEPEESTTG